METQIADAQIKRSSGFAIASFVLGILGIPLSWTILPWLLAIVFGHVARSQIKKSGGAITGNWLCVTGLVLGYFVPVVMIPAAILIPQLSGQ